MTEQLPPTQQQLFEYTQSIQTWFDTAKGQRLLALEKPLIEKALSFYFGRFLLQAGPLCHLSQPIKGIDEIISLGCEGSNADIIYEEHAWPILTEGVEVIVLQHALDFAYSPHDILRESARCVRPGGHLLIVGFNPYSYWGVYRRCHFGILNKSHSISYSRLLDWLRLLGFAVEHTWRGAYGFPCKAQIKDKLMRLEVLGQQRNWWGNGFYIISTRKMMIQPTPLEKSKQSILGKLAPIPVINRNDVRVDE